MSPRKRRKFTAEQKAEAVRLVKEVGSVRRVARDLDLHETVLGRWVRQARVKRLEGHFEPLLVDDLPHEQVGVAAARPQIHAGPGWGAERSYVEVGECEPRPRDRVDGS